MTTADAAWPRWGPSDEGHPDGPSYFRSIFPYRLPPLTEFQADAVPMDPAPGIWITDTTFRDGQQSRSPYTVDQVVHLYDLLHRLGGPRGMVRQTELFLYAKRDREAVERCLARDYRFPE